MVAMPPRALALQIPVDARSTPTSIVLLSAAPEVVRSRLLARTGNDYGKRPGELERALKDQAEVEPLLRAGATMEINTHAPIETVTRRLLAHVFG